MKKKISIEEIIKFLRENGAGSVIKRTDVKKVTCGLVSGGTLANEDHRGEGPVEKIVFSAQGPHGLIGYPIESLARYMEKRGFYLETRE